MTALTPSKCSGRNTERTSSSSPPLNVSRRLKMTIQRFWDQNTWQSWVHSELAKHPLQVCTAGGWVNINGTVIWQINNSLDTSHIHTVKIKFLLSIHKSLYVFVFFFLTDLEQFCTYNLCQSKNWRGSWTLLHLSWVPVIQASSNNSHNWPKTCFEYFLTNPKCRPVLRRATRTSCLCAALFMLFELNDVFLLNQSCFVDPCLTFLK